MPRYPINRRRPGSPWTIGLVLVLFALAACSPLPPPTLQTPSDVQVASGDASLVVSWQSNAPGHNLYLATQPGVTSESYKTLAGGRKIERVTSPFTITGLQNGTTYYLVVTAVDGTGESGESLEIAGTPAAAAAVPTAPDSPQAVTGDGEFTVHWPAVPNAERYTLYLAEEPGVSGANSAQLTGFRLFDDVSSPFTVTGLVNGTTYYLALTASNTLGESAPSAEATVTPRISNGVFDPQGDVTLRDDTYLFDEIRIRGGITVRLANDVLIAVTGDASIDGNVVGDCRGLELRVGGALTLDGNVDTTCSDPTAAPADMKLVVDGDLIIGTAGSANEAIVTDGFISIVDSISEHDPLEPLLEFDSLGTMLAVASLTSPNASIETQAGGAGALNRPIRARRGINVRRNGDLNVGPVGGLTAGDGADSIPAGGLDVANCDRNNMFGGNGGSIYLASRTGALVINGALTAGDGGAGADCYDTVDRQADASAVAGRGGRGGGVYVGGASIHFVGAVVISRGNGGPGGFAEAEGTQGANNCDSGFDASATGGRGGKAGGIGYLYFSPPPDIVGAPTEDGGDGGEGGEGVATGGDANPNCDGDGGAGGQASASGGDGADGFDDCFLFFLGGHGGAGADGTATAGQPGRAGAGGAGQLGKAVAFGGIAGDGGDGIPPGDGGARGGAIALGRNPVQTPGIEGIDGDFCILPLGFFAALDLPEGEILAGYYPLDVYPAGSNTATGDVVGMDVRSDGAYYEVLDGYLIVDETGGLEFTFSGVEFPVTAFRATLNPECSGSGTVRLRGLVDNEVVVDRPFEVGPEAVLLQIEYLPGFDDVYLEAQGTEICLGHEAVELALGEAEQPDVETLLLDLTSLPGGTISPGTDFGIAVTDANMESLPGQHVNTHFQDAFGAEYQVEAGLVYLSTGGLEFDLRTLTGTPARFTVIVDPGLCGTPPGTTITLRALVDNSTVDEHEITIDDSLVTLEVQSPEWIEDVYLETPNGHFCLASGEVSLTVLQ